MKLRVANYRCFTDSNPLVLDLDDGIIALVGPNNSGKSTAIRFFYEFRHLFDQINPDQLKGLYDSPWRGTLSLPSTVGDPTALFNDSDPGPIRIRFEMGDADARPGGCHAGTVEVEFAPGSNGFTATAARTDWSGPTGTNVITREGFLETGALRRPIDVQEASIHIRDLARAVYVGPFRNVLAVQAAEDYYDIKIGRQFVDEWRDLSTGVSRDRQQQARELEQDIERLFGLTNLSIRPDAAGNTLHLTFDQGLRFLDEVGSGLAQFIVVLVNVAVQRPAYVLIDEPELNLHPQLQLDFVTTLASYATRGVIFATHNIGLARVAADRIYSLRRQQDGSHLMAPLDDTPNIAELLGEMSHSLYRELGYSRVLLVEGKTDVKTYAQLLRKFGINDHEFVILPLGGRNLVSGGADSELSHFARLADDIWAVVDSEKDVKNRPLAPRIEDFKAACDGLNIRCHVLERRAIENYLPERAIQAVKGDRYRQLAPYEARNDAERVWGKHDNWRIAREMTRADLERTDLGEFLNEIAAASR